MTTSLGYDVPRAVLTCTAILLLGRRVLASLRRTSRIAAFDAAPEFSPPVPGTTAPVGSGSP
jgi:energy-coupling factor transport system substrate-specific component